VISAVNKYFFLSTSCSGFASLLLLDYLRTQHRNYEKIRRAPQFILSDIVSLHIYWKTGQTCGISGSCFGIKVRRQRNIYTHVSNRDIGKIKSPLDNSQIKGGEDDLRWRSLGIPKLYAIGRSKKYLREHFQLKIGGKNGN